MAKPTDKAIQKAKKKIVEKKTYPPVPEGKRLIFRPWYSCPKTGKRIYPKNGRFFPMIVDITTPTN